MVSRACLIIGEQVMVFLSKIGYYSMFRYDFLQSFKQFAMGWGSPGDSCLSHEPSLMTLAPTNLLQLSGRASERVIGRSLHLFIYFFSFALLKYRYRSTYVKKLLGRETTTTWPITADPTLIIYNLKTKATNI